MKEALCWEKVMESAIKCNLCMRKCLISEGQMGWCQTRINQNGVLYTLTYGHVASISVSPIEKRQMYHFFPGTTWLFLGGLGCNFRCRGCHSWEFSHCDVKKMLGKVGYMSPELVVTRAKKNGCKGIAFTFNEPTVWFEYTLDVFKLAKKEGLSTCYFTNGYMTPEAFDMIAPYLDGCCIDVKGAFMESYTRLADITDINVIFSNGSDAKRRYAMHVEIVTTIIPGFNSNEKEAREIAVWIFAELGKDTPWHVMRFFPYGEMKDVAPTAVSVLENFRTMALKEGLIYVYVGNVPGHIAGHTYCQQCKKMLIKRNEYDESDVRLKEGRCPHCNSLIFGRFAY